MTPSTMLSTYRRTLAAAAITAMLVVSSGCDTANAPANDLLGPSNDLIAYATSITPVKKLVTYVSPTGDATYTQVIGPKGGKLLVSKSSIIVPRGAVDENTVFTAHVLAGDTLHFALSATRVSNGQSYGVFNTAVTLRISYDDLSVSNPSALVVTYLVDGTTSGVKVGLPSTVSKASRSVSAPLMHFSDYAMGEN